MEDASWNTIQANVDKDYFIFKHKRCMLKNSITALTHAAVFEKISLSTAKPLAL